MQSNLSGKSIGLASPFKKIRLEIQLENRDEEAYNDEDIENLLDDSVNEELSGENKTIPDDPESSNDYDPEYINELINNAHAKPKEVFQLQSTIKKSSIQTYNTTLDDSPVLSNDIE